MASAWLSFGTPLSSTSLLPLPEDGAREFPAGLHPAQFALFNGPRPHWLRLPHRQRDLRLKQDANREGAIGVQDGARYETRCNHNPMQL
ncbi:protein of unknown function [Cyanobium sp. NIES-981]|nr:protein of unknown function [Cyanobium sp. NIES-981]